MTENTATPVQAPRLFLRGTAETPQAIRVLITGKLHPLAMQILQSPPRELALSLPLEIVEKPDCSRAELLKEVESAHVLITRSETDVDSEVLQKAKQLSVVARAAVGYGNIDCELATELGILVVNTPGKNTNSAAELTMGLLLSAIRNIHKAHPVLVAGGWDRHRFTGTELLGKTIGIVGLGNVGHRVARFARGFDMKVIAYDPYISDEMFRKNQAERKNTLEELLAECDVLTVHVPLNKETKGMIREIELRKMKKGAIVINAARGGIISESCLLKLLKEGYVAAAGIDTWEKEPQALPELVQHPQVVATPHIGASTEEAQVRIGETVALQTLKALRGEIVDYPVNLPHVTLLGSGVVRQLSVLTEKVARIASQVFDFNPVGLCLHVQGDVRKEELQLLKLSATKGFVANSDDEFVSYVNAERILAKRGLQLDVELTPAGNTARIQFDVLGAHGEKTTLGALLYDGQIPRLSSLNGFDFELAPEGDLLILTNHDRPGVVGDIGCYLAKLGVNIAQFELSRNRKGGMAMSIIRVDNLLDSEGVSGLRKLPNIIAARLVSGL